MVKELMNIQ